MGKVSPSPQRLLREAVVFGSIAIALYIARILSRSIGNGSIKRLGFDDYVMTATVMIYTSMLVLIQLAAHYETNLLDPADKDRILANPQELNDRIFGSKIVVGIEQCMLLSTWGVKTCMLTLFWRLTKNLRLHIYVQIIAAYVAIGFVVIMITYYGVYCRPFSQYWAMPVRNMQCATYQYHSITQAVFNISSDAAMLAVPIPLLIKAQLRMRNKIVLFCIMSLGLFTVVAAILNKAFNFASPLTTIYQIWYIREASTAIYVANLMPAEKGLKGQRPRSAKTPAGGAKKPSNPNNPNNLLHLTPADHSASSSTRIAWRNGILPANYCSRCSLQILDESRRGPTQAIPL
ncbi:hypothetical protein N8T08_008978 [Aspergillus melleus]|uniref:Uncharacterized protein n=1 Tax=Aspergillus melleus TaxID=138277 RepID=A0ACC3AUX0_9EURO|nr:hypothetical protein N8T08_008978 [Aspergillus melleus]